MNEILKELIDDIRTALTSQNAFIEIVSEKYENVFLDANRGDFPRGDTILASTHFKNGATPLDRLNMLEGYLLAKLGE